MATADIRTLLQFLAPEYADTLDATLDTAIGLAQDEIDATRWAAAETADEVTADRYYNRACALLAAHLMTLRDRQGATAAAIKSESTGDASVDYAVAAAASALDATGYGQQLVAFRASIFASAEAIAPAADDEE